MDWETINYGGTEIEAIDFLDGVLVNAPGPRGGPWAITSWPGWYVQEQRGDMDGPALRPRRLAEDD